MLRFDPPAGDVLHADILRRKAKALDLDDSRDVIQRLVREYKEMSGHAALE